MVYNYPFFNFPRNRKYSYYNMTFNGNNKDLNYDNKFSNVKPPYVLNEVKDFKKASSKNEEANAEYFFEIFGLKLYFDDILIMCLIFFLYKEGVDDEYLFMALILLLLS